MPSRDSVSGTCTTSAPALCATPGQRNIKSYYNLIGWAYPLLHRLLPNQVSTLTDVGTAMINSVLQGYPKQVLEIKDINVLARS